MAGDLMRKCVLFLALIFSGASLAEAQQSFSTEAEELLRSAGAPDGANRHGVSIQLEETELKIDASNRVTARHHMIYRIDSPDAVEGWGKVEMEWSQWYQKRPVIHARVVTPDGVEHMLDPKTLSDAPARDRRPELYDDQRIYSGPLPAVRVGAVVEEDITLEDTEPFFSRGVVRRLWFGRMVPVRKRRVTVEVPASLPLKYSVRSLPQISISKEERNGRIRLIFEQNSLPAIERFESNLPPDVPPIPYVVISTAPSWQAIAEEYSRIVENQIASAALEAIAEKHKGADHRETIRNLLIYLHDEVRYTGLEFGDASIVPRSPEETLRRKYGDCKDKAAVLLALLRASGIPAHLALLSTGPGLDIDADHPGMGLFDHAIVYVPGTPDLWIDATDQFRTAGLPYMDQGRMALVASPDTSGLRRTPEAAPEDNLLIEHRLFELPGYGPAKITEISEPRGSAEARYRALFGGGESKVLFEDLQEYVEAEYLAEALSGLEREKGSDLETPFRMTLVVDRGARGTVDLESAVAVIRFDSFFSRFPGILQREPDDEDANQRTQDIVFEPFVTEWRYRFVTPVGFRVHGLPQKRTVDIGPAQMTQSFGVDEDGAVTALIRLNSVKGRYTAVEGRAVREAIQRIQTADPLIVRYEHTGAAEFAAGNVRGALKSYRELSAAHPSEALHCVRLSLALLKAGLGEQAREEARRAVELEPQSALAHSNLGWVLQHDLLGRRFKKGFDLEQAVAEYRKASELDPKDTDILADLGILLEHDASGRRYSSKAQLREAIEVYRRIEEVDHDDAPRWKDNILFDMIYSGQLKEAAAMLADLPQTQERLAMRLAIIAATEGPETAVKRSTEIARDSGHRAPALKIAATILRNLRMYAASAELVTAELEGEANAAQILAQVQMLRNTRPYQERIKSDDPRSAVQRLFQWFIDPDSFDADPLEEFVYFIATVPAHAKRQMLVRQGGALRTQFERLDTPREIVADTVISNMQMAVEGDDKRGYRIRVQPAGAQPRTAFVALLNGRYRLLGLGQNLTGVGVEALRSLESGNTAAARQWLDWAREDMDRPGGDDPFAWPVFPKLWTRGDPEDRSKMRLAALSLFADSDLIGPYFGELKEAAERASGEEKTLIRVMFLAACRALDRWADLKQIAWQALQERPTSDFAFKAVTDSAARTGDWEMWEKAVELRLEKLPDDQVALSSKANMFDYQGKPSEGRAILKKLIDSGRATAMDMNGYGWNALFIGKVEDADIEIVQRASGITQNANYAIIHTLACLYAEVGRTKEAHELLLYAIAAGGLDEPDSPDWYALGRLAEQYGEREAALTAYGRVVEREEEKGLAISTWNLTQRRMRALVE